MVGGGEWLAGSASVRAVACTTYTEDLDEFRGVELRVRFRTWRSYVTDYALVLVADVDGRSETVRVYDSAHGRNELHRYTKELGKRPAVLFHRGTLGEGMRAAKESIKAGYEEMIDGWR